MAIHQTVFLPSWVLTPAACTADSANLGCLDMSPDVSASTQTAFLPSLDLISGNEVGNKLGDKLGDVLGTQVQYGEFVMVALAQSEFSWHWSDIFITDFDSFRLEELILPVDSADVMDVDAFEDLMLTQGLDHSTGGMSNVASS